MLVRMSESLVRLSESVTKTGRQTPSKCTGRQTPTKEVNYGTWVQLPGYRRYANRLLPVRNVGTDNAEVGYCSIQRQDGRVTTKEDKA